MSEPMPQPLWNDGCVPASDGGLRSRHGGELMFRELTEEMKVAWDRDITERFPEYNGVYCAFYLGSAPDKWWVVCYLNGWKMNDSSLHGRFIVYIGGHWISAHEWSPIERSL